jgi:ribosomal protein S18 acetylase RimI-like enzyme
MVIDGSIACIFTVAYSDPLIWGEKKNEPALYIHRIVTNLLFRERGFVKIIFEWAKEYGRKLGKKFIRIDTWSDNQKLIDYYTECGFTFQGFTTPAISNELSIH